MVINNDVLIVFVEEGRVGVKETDLKAAAGFVAWLLPYSSAA